MIELRNESRKVIAITPEAPSGVIVPFGACTSALCPCGEVKLTFPGGKEAMLDPFTRGASGNASPVFAEFSAHVASELTNDSWDLLTQAVLSGKRLDMDGVDAGKGTWTFDEADIELRGAMVPYHEVFRFSTPVLADVDGEGCYLDDGYCVRPECPCTEVAVSVVPRNATGVVQPRAEFYFDYARLTARMHPQRPITVTGLQSLCGALLEQQPGLPTELATRHRRMQALYVRSRRGVAAMDRARAGRNDPCPCGSGQKYKKCCGA